MFRVYEDRAVTEQRSANSGAAPTLKEARGAVEAVLPGAARSWALITGANVWSGPLHGAAAERDRRSEWARPPIRATGLRPRDGSGGKGPAS